MAIRLFLAFTLSCRPWNIGFVIAQNARKLRKGIEKIECLRNPWNIRPDDELSTLCGASALVVEIRGGIDGLQRTRLAMAAKACSRC